jgi:hypothetical protein
MFVLAAFRNIDILENLDDTNFQKVPKRCLNVPYATLHMTRAIAKSKKPKSGKHARTLHLHAVFFSEFLEQI